MKSLLIFEMRKIWARRWICIPAAYLLILALWVIATGGRPLRSALNGNARRMDEETKPYWGQVMTEELRAIAKEKALAYGAVEDTVFGESTLDAYPVAMRYGEDSEEFSICTTWCALYTEPTFEEVKANYQAAQDNYRLLYEQGRIGEAFYSSLGRAKEPAAWQVIPRFSAWNSWLDPMGYGSMVAGVCALLLIVLFFSDVFSMEEGGGIGEISLSTKKKKHWVLSKIIAAAISGAILSFSLYFGLLVFYGVLFGFQGWNLGVLAITAGGYSYGMLYHECSALALTAIKLLMIMLSGAFLAVLVAACSALLRNTVAATGTALSLVIGMECLLFVEYSIKNLPSMSRYVSQWDWIQIETLLTSPVRMFLNVELLTMQTMHLESSFSTELINNILVTPDLLLTYTAAMVAGIALCAAVCFTYQRQR